MASLLLAQGVPMIMAAMDSCAVRKAIKRLVSGQKTQLLDVARGQNAIPWHRA